jgi:hypothetical protein
MKPQTTAQKVSTSSQNLVQIIRIILIVYFISAAIILVICFIFGWRSMENIGTGFIYGSLGLALFGALLLAGNTVPAQLSKLSLPKYIAPSLRRHQEFESDASPSIDRGKRFFFTTLICGAFLFVTGLFLKML